MSQENVQTVRRAIEAVVRRPPDWDAVNALFDPKHELHELPDFVDFEGARVGAAGFRDWRTMMKQTGDWRVDVEDVKAAPDGRIAVLMRFLLTGERSSANVEQKMCLLCSVQNGKITRTEAFAGWQAPLQAVGLAE
jgi:ketosteroid isomerase-like protein